MLRLFGRTLLKQRRRLCLLKCYSSNSCQSILVLNPGSTSMKCAAFNICDLQLDFSVPPFYSQQINLTKENRDKEISEFLSTNIDEFSDLQAVGLRTVHGGQHFKETTLVTAAVVRTLEELISLAPLHLPPLLTSLNQVTSLLPHVPCYVAFDTSFFSELPSAARFYPLPYEMAEQGFIKYGFHGLNHRHCCEKISLMLDGMPSRLITCHLGGGASVSAIKDGRCIDTSMGYTPLDGIMMTTRCGSLDPSIVLRMVKDANGDVSEVERILNQQSGVAGISGLSDLKVATEQRQENPRADLACAMFLNRLCKTIGGYIAVLGGIDGLVFSGGIGENDSSLRKEVVEQLSFLGIELDEESNDINTKEDRIISTSSSAVTTAVIHAKEELVIAQDIMRMTTQSFDI